ncbi:hypothetical protein [Jeotgalibacillus salarius]|uniref:Uncharacterized protein n=1 Tax=Jeotgalibacillus salarius TaxID=546023 RepID=A0A4Y8LK12_9BACL|nr:hypothetical protein [Jeotgalibacillus salarius]TFE02925.1 hypothetical protein E2626_03710 [Jeotgalibacillus salarius]
MEKKLFWWIGAFIFGGLAVQVFIQLEPSDRVEALISIFVGAVLYSGLVLMHRRNKKIWLMSTGVLSAAAIVMIFVSPHLFGH